ncbi:MAG: lycopene cyclase domain-containing protein [Bacteroidia bacterium]|nr:lycopene cyclase domain-containing protein [Bacteroidia bacterium]
MKSYTYLLVNFFCILIPFIASFYKPWPFFKKWKSFIKSAILVTIPFLIWDIAFTQKGVWGFNQDYLVGIDIINLPLEEILFFLCIPYACVFTYFSFKYLFPTDPLEKYNRILLVIFSIISLIFIAVGFDQKYTFFTGIFTLAFLLYIYWKKISISHLFLSYFAILPFFFLSNGILTGSFIEAPIVWYNDAENFGIRMGTIPMEDSIYGFLLITGNIVLFNHFEASSTRITLDD